MNVPALKRLFILCICICSQPLSAVEKDSIDYKLTGIYHGTNDIISLSSADSLILSFNQPIDTAFGTKVFIDNIEFGNLLPIKNAINTYILKFNKDVSNPDSLRKRINNWKDKKATMPLKIGTNITDAVVFSPQQIIDLDKTNKTPNWVIGIIIILLCALSIFMVSRKNFRMIRDISTKKDFLPAFSLSRSQMAFWTLLILIAFFVVWLNTGKTIEITAQVLALLGISAGTALSAQLIDNGDIDSESTDPKIDNSVKRVTRHQDEKSSKNFLVNLMSDRHGISVHRFQNVMFTIAIGTYFLVEVFENHKVPDIHSSLLILMGISSGTYLALKNGENK